MIFKKALIIAGISGLALTAGGQAWSGQKVTIGSPDAGIHIADATDNTKLLIKSGKAKIKKDKRGTKIKAGRSKIKKDRHGTKIKAGNAAVDSDGNIRAGGVRISPDGGIKID